MTSSPASWTAGVHREVLPNGLTLLGIAVTNLDAGRGIQLELPVTPPYRPAADFAVDEVRKRFGSDKLRRASATRRGHGTDSLDAEPSASARPAST